MSRPFSKSLIYKIKFKKTLAVLNFLSIENVVLIDKAEVKFSSGFCVLSGETGSGKSILLDALGLAIGFRSSFRLIGNEHSKASIGAEFDISKNHFCQKLLQDNDLLDADNPNVLRIRRIIQENSSSKVYVNDHSVGVNLLAQIGEKLVEIHGQHDQRGLLNQAVHIKILDEFARNQELIKIVKKNYEDLREVEEKIAELESKKEQAKREKDYLEHVVKELKSADVKVGEEDELVAKKNQFSSKEKILNFLGDLNKNLNEANSGLVSSQRILIRNQNLIDNFLPEEKLDFDQLNEKIDQINSELDGKIDMISEVIRKLSNSDESLEAIEERLFYIKSLARKFAVTCDEIPNFLTSAEEKLQLISGEEEMSSDFQKQHSELLKIYKKNADELSKKRKSSAEILSKKVEEELGFLKMPNTKFLVEITDAENEQSYGPSGYNRVKFLASINRNNADDISKIASGGELSRFMLALKVALMDVRSVPTMIFDEIDTGIGGMTSDAVGKRLKILSQKLQILVVTHQPQIASKADTIFKVSKISDEKKIKTTIETLDEEDRQKEIARMLSGEKITPESMLAAQKLISDN
jgi:DNA repair protein RecN (Recombination protein N)